MKGIASLVSEHFQKNKNYPLCLNIIFLLRKYDMNKIWTKTIDFRIVEIHRTRAALQRR